MRPVVHSPQDGASVQPMPPLSIEQLDALRADIIENGVLVPVAVDQHGRIIDGNNRASIAAELGIDCPTVSVFVADDDAAIDLALTLNCARRHLSQDQKRAIIAGEIDRRPTDTDRAIARRVGCSPTTVGTVRRGLSNLDTGAAARNQPDFDAEQFEEGLKQARAALFALASRALTAGVSVPEVVGALAMARVRYLRRGHDKPDAARMFSELVYDFVIEVTTWEETREEFEPDPSRVVAQADREALLSAITSISDREHPADRPKVTA